MKKIFSILIALLTLCGVAQAQTITFTAGTDVGSQTTSTGADEISKDGITLSVTRGALAAAQYRITRNQTLTVTSTVGDIQKVVFTCTASGTATYGPGCFAEQDGYSYDGTVGTWTGSSESVSFVVSTGQVRATKIEVTVKNPDPNYVVTPKITPSTGTYYLAQTVTITCDTEDATIYYTTDDSSPIAEKGGPSETAIQYSAPFVVEQTTTIKAVAMKDGPSSKMAEELITIEHLSTQTIAELLAAGPANAVQTSATVVAVSSNGVLLQDATGYIFAYTETGHELIVGDVVTVSGPVAEYGGRLQFSLPQVQKTGTAAVSYPTAVVLDGAAFDALVADVQIQYVEVAATVTSVGNYYNLSIPDATNTGSLIATSDVLSQLRRDDAVTITGFFVYATGTSRKYGYIIATKVDLPQVDYTEYNTLAEVKAGAPADEASETDAQLNVEDFLVSYVNGQSVYLFDGTDGVLIYGTNSKNLKTGDKISGTIKGKLYKHYGNTQLANPVYDVTVISSGNEVVPQEVAAADLLASNGAAYENELVRINYLFPLTTAWDNRSISFDAYTDDSYETIAGVLAVRDSWNVAANLPFDNDTPYMVTGFVTVYSKDDNTTIQLYPRTVEDIDISTVEEHPGDDNNDGSWEAPVKPEAPDNPAITQFLPEATAVEAGRSYYVMNVGCGQFLTGANSWATQISLTANATPYMKVIVADISAGGDPNGKSSAKGDGYTMRLDGTFYFTGGNNRTNYAVSDTYLFRDTEESGYLDLNYQNRGFVWKFTPTPNGHYYIQVISEDTNFPNAATQYAGGVVGEGLGGGKPVKFNCSSEDANIEWAFIPSDIYYDEEEYQAKVADYLVAVAPYFAAMKAYEARVTLYKTLNDAVTYGADYTAASDVYNNNASTAEAIQKAATNLQTVIDARKPFVKLFEDAAFYGADVTAAKTVYDNAAASVEELNAAYAELTELMPAAVIAYAARNGTADTPCAMPYVIANADFETPGSVQYRAPIGWTLTAGIGQNQGYQDNAVYENEEAGIKIEHFIEVWHPTPNVLGNGQIYQEIAGLPSGHYILECDGIARNQTAAGNTGYVAPEDYTGIYLFYNDGAITVHSDESLKDILVEEVDEETGYLIVRRLPTHFTFEFDIDEVESIKIGLMSENTNLNWMAVDNFVIKYAGPSQRVYSYTALFGELNVSANVMLEIDNSDFSPAEATIVEAFRKVYNDAQELYDAGYDAAKDAAYKAASTELCNAREAYNVSHEAYSKVSDFIDKIDKDLQKFEEKAGYGTLVTTLGALLEHMSGAYEGGISGDEIIAAIDGYDALIKEQIQGIFNDAVAAGKPLDEGLDITPLFEHMSFAYGTTQTAYKNGYPAENPVWMNETKTGNFKTNYSTAEVWDARPFNIYRDFTNLPKGKYTIKTHAFYRVTANDTNYPNYIDGVYDEEVNEYAYIYAGNHHKHLVNNAALTTGARVDNGYDTGEGTYIVNNQNGAHLLFTDEKYSAQAEAAYISVSASVIEDGGTLRAGFAGTDLLENNHWCVFDGFELYYDGLQESLDEDLMALLDELNELEDEQVGSRVVATVKLMEDAKAVGEAAIGQKVDVQTAAILQLQNAIKTAKESEELSLTVMNLVDEYQNRLNDMEVKGTFTDMRIQEILEEILAGLDMGEIESNEQIQGWIAALPEAMLNFILSMEELNEATMENPVEVPIIYNPDYTLGSNHYEGWMLETTATGGNIGKYYDSGYLEFWNNSPVGSQWIIYQDLAKLKEGYYRLQVDGLYRAAGSAGDIQNLKEGEVKYDEYLFAGEMSKPVIAWTDFENGALLGTLAELHETEGYENIDGTEYWYEKAPNESVCFVVPNSCAQMRTFADAGRYQNTLDFGYKEGSVRIGMKALTTYANNWSPFGSWKLFYLGTTYEGPDPTPEYPDPITHKLPDPVSPTMPTRAAFDGDWVTPEAGYTYYIYNEGAAQFMGCGRDWGTRTITTTDSIASPTGAQIRHGANKNFVLPFNIESDGGGYLYIRSFRTDQAYTYVTALAEEENKSWYDGNAARAAHWQLLPVGDNAFLLHDALIDPYDANAYVEDDPETDENEQDAVKSKYSVLGIDAVESASYTWTDAWVGVNASGKSYKVTWKFVEASDDVAMSIRAWREETQADLDEAMKVYNNLLAIYNAKLTLRTTIEAAERASLDVTDAEAIYNSETATEAEVLAANGALLLAIAIQGTTPPVDITNALVNPDFEDGNINGWETNYVSGKQAQNIGCEGSTFTNGEITISGFFVSWISAPATIGDGYLQQTIYGLPAGKYRLECDAIAVQQSNESDTTTGAYLFIQSGTGESRTSMTTGNREPEHFEVSFNNVGGMPLTFGVKTVSTSANWIGADNFKLWYEGELTESPHYIQLKNYLAQVQDQYSSEDLGNAYLCSDSLTALNNAMTVADNISTSASDVECDAAYAALEKAMSGVLTSIKVYETLLPYTSLNEEGSKLAYYEEVTANNNWYELSEQLHNDQEAFDNAYEEGTWSDDEVVANIDGILPSMITWVQDHPEALQPGNDLTMLLINADFEDGEYNAGWDAKDDEVQPDNNYGTLPGWTISSGNITRMNHVIETYHRKFDFNQTIENMPAGVYDISVQGFVRHDGSATDQTLFYAGDLETPLMQRSDQWSATVLYDPNTMGRPCGDNFGDQTFWNSRGEEVWLPNGMSGFYFWEMVENTEGAYMDYLKWKEGDLYYTNHLRVYLAEPAELTIGLKCLVNTDWIMWDNFRIKYLGGADNLYAEMAAEKFEELNRVYENDNNHMFLTEQAMAEYSEIAIFDYTTINSLEAYQDYSEQCDSLINYIQEGTQLGQGLYTLIMDYEYRCWSTEVDMNDFMDEYISEYMDRLDTGGTFADNNAYRAVPELLAKGWTKCVQKQAEEMLFGNNTPVIYNAKYRDYEDDSMPTLKGWSLEKADSVTLANYYANEGVAEVYAPSGEYTHYQTLVGLQPGYYRVTMDGFFRPGEAFNSIDPEAYKAMKRAYLFGESNVQRVEKPLKNVLEGAQDWEIGVGSERRFRLDDAETGESRYVFTPNNMAAACAYFENVFEEAPVATDLMNEDIDQSVYRNTITLEVGEDSVLTIGISNVGMGYHVRDWVCFSNWTLSYMGTERPSDMPEEEEPEEPEGLLGDVNGDGSVDVVDITTVVDFILEKAVPTAAERTRADVNKDASIDVVDLTTIVSIILETYTPTSNVTRAPARRDASVTTDVLTMSGADISLDNLRSYVACQMDVTLADGATLKGVELSDRAIGFSKSYSKIADNTYRVVVYSLGNEPFEGCEGTLLKLNILGDQYSSISNALFTDGHKAYRLEVADIVDGVNGITPSSSKRGAEIFSLSGQKLNRLQKGVNIVNGKKVQVK